MAIQLLTRESERSLSQIKDKSTRKRASAFVLRKALDSRRYVREDELDRRWGFDVQVLSIIIHALRVEGIEIRASIPYYGA